MLYGWWQKLIRISDAVAFSTVYFLPLYICQKFLKMEFHARVTSLLVYTLYNNQYTILRYIRFDLHTYDNYSWHLIYQSNLDGPSFIRRCLMMNHEGSVRVLFSTKELFFFYRSQHGRPLTIFI